MSQSLFPSQQVLIFYFNSYIHQYSTITQIYFENVFCLSPITSSSGRTETGIRVGLSDTSQSLSSLRGTLGRS